MRKRSCRQCSSPYCRARAAQAWQLLVPSFCAAAVGLVEERDDACFVHDSPPVEWLRRLSGCQESRPLFAPAVRRWSRFPAQVPACSRHSFLCFYSPRNAPAIWLAGKSLVTDLPAAKVLRCCLAGSAHALNHDDAHRPVTKIDSSAGSERPLMARRMLFWRPLRGGIPWAVMHWESMERILGDAFAIVNRFGLIFSMISDAIAPQFLHLLTRGWRRLPCWDMENGQRSQKACAAIGGQAMITGNPGFPLPPLARGCNGLANSCRALPWK